MTRSGRHAGPKTSPGAWSVARAVAAWALCLSVAPWAGMPAAASNSDLRPEGAPRIRVEQPRLDLGTVVRGRTVSAVFRFENVGDAPLRILEAKPG